MTTFAITIKPDTKLGVDLRELHAALESKQDFSTWAKARLSQFTENEDFSSLHKSVERETGATRRIEYAVSVECAKHIAMMEQTERGRQVRAYFIECERKALAPRELSRLELLELAMDSERQRLALASKVEELQPKADVLDTLLASPTVCKMAVAAQVAKLPFGSVTLFQKLRERGVLISGGDRHNLPKQRYIEQGLFTVNQTSYTANGQTFVKFTTYVTQKGIAKLIEHYGTPSRIIPITEGAA